MNAAIFLHKSVRRKIRKALRNGKVATTSHERRKARRRAERIEKTAAA